MEVGSGLGQIRDGVAGQKSIKENVEGFNDKFPDDILMQIFKRIRSSTNLTNVVAVCKRWYILGACTQMHRRVARIDGGFPCLGFISPIKECAKHKTLKWNKVESEWTLAQQFVKSCKCHTHSLEINDCTHLTPRGYVLISYLGSNLKSLRLESCSLIQDGNLIEILEACPNLRSLHLSKVPKLKLKNVDKKVFRLEELHVLGCGVVTGGTVLAVLKGLSCLRSLCLSGMSIPSAWENEDFRQGAALKLRTLELRNTKIITDRALYVLGGRLSNLRNLDLSNCAEISDDGLRPLLVTCGGTLQKLVLTRCSKITDASVRELCAVASIQFRVLSLSGTNITNDSLRLLGDSEALELRQLSLACCSKLSDDILPYVVSLQRRRRTALKILDIQNCPRLSASGLKSLQTVMTKTNSKLVCSPINL